MLSLYFSYLYISHFNKHTVTPVYRCSEDLNSFLKIKQTSRNTWQVAESKQLVSMLISGEVSDISIIKIPSDLMIKSKTLYCNLIKKLKTYMVNSSPECVSLSSQWNLTIHLRPTFEITQLYHISKLTSFPRF